MKRVDRSAIVPYDARRMYALVDDIEAYAEFLPWCAEARVHERAAGRTVATICVGLRGLRQSFTTENSGVEGERIDMRLVKGPFSRFSATWTFTALSPEATRIAFALELEFSSRLVARALEPVFRNVADTMVDAFCRRAESLYGDAAH